ncbi:hypothetical protein ColLi_06676 [Colletotrichum liriopes]|uniref:Uncharacterized protein n=1 Tax=Colletotrichum liriopes TaxID=708192 RepID=A0AA37GMN4_9PEZI|nr:hypothetical protein ColLi_06676 [Colletotrichum liriopes]
MDSYSQDAKVYSPYLLVNTGRNDGMPDQETRFLENLAVAPTYPDTLLHPAEEAAVTNERREHYAEKKARVFDALRGGGSRW